MDADLGPLRAILGHEFRDPELLLRALTHKSRAYENNLPQVVADNEQLEFLGDSVLGMFVSEYLVRTYPESPEGKLSKLKSHLVSAHHLNEAARRLDLGRYLLLGRGEEMSGGRGKNGLLANALEAVIAAIYLDGGPECAKAFVRRHIIAEFVLPELGQEPLRDYKSALQELAQTLNLPQPRYSIVAESGPEHAKTFSVEVRVGPNFTSRADGVSKKSAGQKAAENILARLRGGISG